MRQVLLALLLLCSVGCAVSVSPTLQTMHTLDFIQKSGHMPMFWDLPGDTHAKQLTALVDWLTRRGIKVGFVPVVMLNGRSVLGLTRYTDGGGRQIFVANKESLNSQLYILLHEAAHAYQPMRLTDNAGEVFAELVAVQVCKALGLDVAASTASYLSVTTDGSLRFQWLAADTFNREIDALVLLFKQATTGSF